MTKLLKEYVRLMQIERLPVPDGLKGKQITLRNALKHLEREFPGTTAEELTRFLRQLTKEKQL